VLAGVPVDLAVDDPVRRIKPRPSCPEGWAVCGRRLSAAEIRLCSPPSAPLSEARLPANRIGVVACLSAATVLIGRE